MVKLIGSDCAGMATIAAKDNVGEDHVILGLWCCALLCAVDDDDCVMIDEDSRPIAASVLATRTIAWKVASTTARTRIHARMV